MATNKETSLPSREAHFQKKVYTKMPHATLGKTITPHSFVPSNAEATAKKTISFPMNKGMREEFKKTFLPLLIDVFELRQMIESHKMKQQTPILFPEGKVGKSPREILERLQELQGEIEESQKWCEGVIKQISRGIDEAKEALQYLDNEKPETPPRKKNIFVQRWKSFWNRWK